MLFPQARRVSPRTVLLRRKTTPRDRKMFTTSVAAALIHRALVRKPRKAKSCGGNRYSDGTPAGHFLSVNWVAGTHNPGQAVG